MVCEGRESYPYVSFLNRKKGAKELICDQTHDECKMNRESWSVAAY